jgi:hypothetical protein
MVPPTLPDDRRVNQLLLALWDAPKREFGLPVVDLPDEIRTDAVILSCLADQLVLFATPAFWTLLPDWGGKPAGKRFSHWIEQRKFDHSFETASALLRQVLTSDVRKEERTRLRLTELGELTAAKLALAREAPVAADKTQRRGRKAAPETEQKDEEQLARDWEKAHETGVSKVDFANDKGKKLVDFDRILDRVAKRKKRKKQGSDNSRKKKNNLSE